MPPRLLVPLLLALTLSACADDDDLYEGVPPDISGPAAGDPEVASGIADDDVVPGSLGNVPLDDFLLDPDAVVGPYAETVLVDAAGGEAVGAALFVLDEGRGHVLYYRVSELPPGAYTLRLGRDCGAEGATSLGAVEPTSGVATGQRLLDAVADPAAADDQVLMVMSDADRPVACGPVELVGAAG